MKNSLPPGAADCPVCHASCGGPPLYRYTAAQAATHFCPPARNLDRFQRLQACVRKLWQGDECVVLRCGKCGFGFGHPFVGGDEEYYSILHEQKGYPGWIWDFDFAVREALARFDGGRIMDVGAGTGAFLRGLKTGWECFALEASESNRRDLEAAGIRVFRDLEQAATAEAGRFQCVTMFQALEHIADFRPVLQACRKLLEPGGRIVITVPDGEAMIRQERLTGFPDMPPNHINKWTLSSLSLVLNETGFVVEQDTYEPTHLKSLTSALHMRVLSDATQPGSVAGRVYRIQNRRIRAPLVASLAVPALIRMLPNTLQLLRGGSFGVVGKAR